MSVSMCPGEGHPREGLRKSSLKKRILGMLLRPQGPLPNTHQATSHLFNGTQLCNGADKHHVANMPEEQRSSCSPSYLFSLLPFS